MEGEGSESWLGSGRLKERGGLDRRRGWGFGGQAQMRQDLHNHRGIFDDGDERYGATTLH